MSQELTHFDSAGRTRMVDVASKPITLREAVATAQVRMAPATLSRVAAAGTHKGNVLEVARLAGIMAAKRTGELIPLCHPIGLDGVELDLTPAGEDRVTITGHVRTRGRTGVEMEALTAVAVAALTVVDMVKSMDRDVEIERVRLESKSGGQSGDWRRSDQAVASQDQISVGGIEGRRNEPG